jgi:hypothetical protein
MINTEMSSADKLIQIAGESISLGKGFWAMSRGFGSGSTTTGIESVEGGDSLLGVVARPPISLSTGSPAIGTFSALAGLGGGFVVAF